MDHDAITKVMTNDGATPIGIGAASNPYAEQCSEWARKKAEANTIEKITEKIKALFEPRFITPPETGQFIEALVTMVDAKSVLELGTYSGFTTLHMLRALVGKPNARIVSIDCRPTHDQEFWKQFPDILTHVPEWTPQCLNRIQGLFDVVFVDSDHTENHTQSELEELMKLTHEDSIFIFHDLAKWQTPDNPTAHPARRWLLERKELRGVILPTARQLDCAATWGENYPKQCNPHLGVFMRASSQ